ncbi:MAG: phosphoribosylanthranilate isomerase, partial [Candidatus Omnitrophica bacterium]|nr:phosphoribosylanthranilate isomerase [Candidatus Omnitrophota bacterium]
MVKVKVCGITNEEDAVEAVQCGADFLGFIFIENTTRFVEESVIKKIVSCNLRKTKQDIVFVGLFKDENLEKVTEKVNYCGLNCVQLHGDESPDYCARLKKVLLEEYDTALTVIKSFKVAEEILPNIDYSVRDYDSADYFVFDTFHSTLAGGTGTKFNVEVLKKKKWQIEKPFFVAGGLTPQNVSDVVKNIAPYGVDVSSGVESVPGKKDKN